MRWFSREKTEVRGDEAHIQSSVDKAKKSRRLYNHAPVDHLPLNVGYTPSYTSATMVCSPTMLPYKRKWEN